MWVRVFTRDSMPLDNMSQAQDRDQPGRPLVTRSLTQVVGATILKGAQDRGGGGGYNSTMRHLLALKDD
jgi:hypothetical protein